MRTLVFLSRTIGSRVVLIAIDIAAHLILLMIHLSAFLPGQVAAVCGAVVVHFLVDIRFFVFEVAGFARSQLGKCQAHLRQYLDERGLFPGGQQSIEDFQQFGQLP